MNTTVIVLSSLLFSNVQLAQLKMETFGKFSVTSFANATDRIYKSDRYFDDDSFVKGIASFLDEFDEEIASIHEDEYDISEEKRGETDSLMPPALSLIPIPIFENEDEVKEEADLNMPSISAEPVTPSSLSVKEIDVSGMTFDPAYSRFKSTPNTSTFLYRNLKYGTDYIDYVRNLSTKAS